MTLQLVRSAYLSSRGQARVRGCRMWRISRRRCWRCAWGIWPARVGTHREEASPQAGKASMRGPSKPTSWYSISRICRGTSIASDPATW